MRQDLTDICSKKHDIDFLITFRNTLKQDLEVEYLNRRIRSSHEDSTAETSYGDLRN